MASELTRILKTSRPSNPPPFTFTHHPSPFTLPDTLVIDSAQIAQWQAQQDFDYNRELVGGGMTFTEWLMMQVREFLNDIFGGAVNSTVVQWVLAILAVGVLGFIAWYLWRQNSGIFRRQEQGETTDCDAEDTIYGVDFGTAISQAVANSNFREAIRLRYLQTLKALTDASLIDWQPFKTPTQYVREFSAACSLCSGGAAVPTAAAPAAFRTLTAHFLRVRYGNFPATRPLYDEVEQLGKEVVREP